MKKIAFPLIILVAASLACSLPSRVASSEDQATIPVSTEAAGQAEDQMSTAVAELATSGQVTVMFTEAQLTSYIAQKLALQSDSPLQDPQIHLQDGVIVLTGKAQLGPASAQANVSMEPYADQGNLQLKIDEAKVGKLPLPQNTLDSLSQALNDNLDELVSVNGSKFYLETITIADGQLTLSGHLQ